MPLVVTLAIATLVQSPFTAVADSPPLYKKERESLASHVFAGVVLQTYVRTEQQGNFVYEYGVVEVDDQASVVEASLPCNCCHDRGVAQVDNEEQGNQQQFKHGFD